MPILEDFDIRIVIPAFNEEAGIAAVVRRAPSFVREVIVVDNASSDATAVRAAEAGARVVSESRRGYGRACKAGIAAAGPCDIIVFMDADGADTPDEMASLVTPIAGGDADLVIGSRTLGNAEPGALTPQQCFGNRLACLLMRLFWGGRFTDLGPFRAIRRDALERIAMDDNAFGWTVEMQARALKFGLQCAESPANYRRRIGRSKISGTVRGVLMAGATILYVLARERVIDGPFLRVGNLPPRFARIRRPSSHRSAPVNRRQPKRADAGEIQSKQTSI